MKKVLPLFVFILLYSVATRAQSAEDSVKAAVNLLFEGMKSSDGSKIAASFADSAVLQTIMQTKDGKTIVRDEKVSEFVSSVSKLGKGDADERIEFGTIKIDGPLAIVWTPYKFYYKGNFSHCGVNSFQLVRFNGTWKIQYLIDTRRRQGCE